MKRLKELLIPAILAIAFIFLTAFGANGNFGFGWLSSFCFNFHLIPFGIGFAGGGGIIILVYYVALWLVLTTLFIGIGRLFVLLFKRTI